METLENAIALLLEHAPAVMETERVSLTDALGRIAAEDILSAMNVPPFDRSPLDGYALHSADIASASKENPVTVKVIGEACAGCGEHYHPASGEAVRVMTGAPVPPECDCVIRQEDTDQGEDLAQMYAPVGAGKNVCYEGEDVKKGSLMLKKGDKITPAHIGVLAGVGVTDVSVYRRVRAALLCTGDELKQPGEELTYGKIYDANRATISARLAVLGIDTMVLPSRCDDPQIVADALKEAAGKADIMITTGGVSVGKKDIFHQVLPLMGAERLFWKVAIKPGTPMMCGLYNGKLLICLSGNPFAASACFDVIAVPVLRALGGSSDTSMHRAKAKLRGSFGKASAGRRLIRAALNGDTVTVPQGNHSSGSLSTMIGCNCVIDIPAGTPPLNEGDMVEVICFD